MKHFFYYTSFLTCFFWFINLCPSLKHTDAPAITDGLWTSLCSLLSGCKYPCGISKRRKHKTKLCKLMIKQLLNSVLAKYRDLSVSRRSIICLCLRHRQKLICSPLTNHDILREPSSIIDNYCAILAKCFKKDNPMG